MAGNMKEIKQRIRSVESTRQITKAMELVASSKLRHAKERADAARPRFVKLQEMIGEMAAHAGKTDSIYMKRREELPTLFLVIAGDRGLAGGYNGNIFKLAQSEMQENDWVTPVGRKACEYFMKRPYHLHGHYAEIAEHLSYGEAGELAKRLLEPFCKGEVGEVRLLYTRFLSPLTQQPQSIRLLPLEAGETTGSQVLTEYDPSPEAVLGQVVPLYFSWILYGGIAESFASEQAARRTAMDAASKNAGDMIDELSLKFNRARQGAITQEINELIAGSTANS